jgi:hypothetical protein
MCFGAAASISWIRSLLFLVDSFTAIIEAKNVQTSAILSLGSTDCTAYTFAYAGKPAWGTPFPQRARGEKKFNHHSNLTAVELTVLDVQHQLYPTYFNVTSPDTGMLGCFCMHMLANHPADATKVQVQDPGSARKRQTITTPCQTYLRNYGEVQVMASLAVLAVIIVNEILKAVFRTLTAFEGHETHTEEILSLAMKLFAAMLVNTAFLIVLISGNINLVTAGAKGLLSRILDQVHLFSGNIDDFDSDWYRLVGAAIATTM